MSVVSYMLSCNVHFFCVASCWRPYCHAWQDHKLCTACAQFIFIFLQKQLSLLSFPCKPLKQVVLSFSWMGISNAGLDKQTYQSTSSTDADSRCVSGDVAGVGATERLQRAGSRSSDNILRICRWRCLRTRVVWSGCNAVTFWTNSSKISSSSLFENIKSDVQYIWV